MLERVTIDAFFSMFYIYTWLSSPVPSPSPKKLILQVLAGSLNLITRENLPFFYIQGVWQAATKREAQIRGIMGYLIEKLVQVTLR